MEELISAVPRLGHPAQQSCVVGARVRRVENEEAGEDGERNDRRHDSSMERGHDVAPAEEHDTDDPNEERLGGEVPVGNLPGPQPVFLGFARTNQSAIRSRQTR